ncbi:MAG: hypothetical protein IT203_02550 [Fimbriimonadaceae bacterium]|nr:hypothetical protein [Fimbriimonadaceae bacterium]
MRALRDHIRPFVLIQICVVAAVVAYYRVPDFATFAGSMARAKDQGGLVFSFVSTMFAGMVLPELFKLASNDPRRYSIRDLAYNGLVFGLNGMIVDLFYRFQGYVFGHETTFQIVAIKVAFDQLFASPFLFNPFFVLMFLYREAKFRGSKFRELLRSTPYSQRLMPVLLVSWAYWIPALCGVYALPANLQFVLFLFVEAAWSLILLHITKSMQEVEA